MYIDVTKAKFQELIDAVKAKNEETENKLIWCLALIGGVVIVAIIAYAVYRFLTPDYYDDYDDDDFDDDFDDFDDFDDEDDEDVEEEPAAEQETQTEEQAEEQTEEPAAEPIGIHHAEIEVKDYGTIKLELDGDTAPITVQNFMDLANKGFYDGLTFHRIMDRFMIQGGDPLGNGTGGSDKNIKGEFAMDGVDNNISHVKGVISMARAQDPDSASSQFFITVADSDFLDGQYAAFGHVTEGQEVADKIAADAKPLDDNGTIAPEDQPVIESVKITD